MPCKQSELITAINSFAAARVSDDGVLTKFSANLVAKLLDTLTFDPEEVVEEEEVAKAAEETEAVTETEVVAEAGTGAPVLKDPPVKKTKSRAKATA